MAKQIKPLPYYSLYATDAERDDAVWLRHKFVPRIKRRLKGHHLAGFTQDFIVKEVALHKKTYPFFVRCDIRQFYPSIYHSTITPAVCTGYRHLHTLSYTPQSFKDRVLLTVSAFLRRLPVGKGLPLANPLSGILAQTLLLPLWLDIKKRFGVPFIVFMDDILVFARTASQAQYIYQHIHWRLQHDYHLELNDQKCVSGRFANTPFEFCGWQFSGGYARISPAKKQAFKERMITVFAKARRSDDLRSSLKRINRKIDGFGNHYKYGDVAKQFDELDKWIRKQLRQVLADKYPQGKNMHTLKHLTSLGLHNLELCYKRAHDTKAKTLKQVRPPHMEPVLSENTCLHQNNQHLETIADYLYKIKLQNKEMLTAMRQLLYAVDQSQMPYTSKLKY